MSKKDCVLYLEDGTEVQMPTKKIVCPCCNGEGKQVNPAIDGNGITGEEMHELGEDFLEDYLSGVYDIPCLVCEGQRVVDIVDNLRCEPEQLAAWERQVRECAESHMIEEMERRMGA